MKISYNWLKEYADIDISVEEISNLLTDCGLEVDGIEEHESIRGGLKGLVIGEVITCEDHPDSDHLHLTTVNIGEEGNLSIVCGAENVATGQKVVVATIGATLYSGDESFKIKKSKIRGKESFGMICAEDEIGIGDSHAGIMVLPEGAVVGVPAANYFNLSSDYIFEIGLTPNRSDATSHIGVARDIVAVLNSRNFINAEGDDCELLYPNVEDFKIDCKDIDITVEVKDNKNCPRYSGLCIKGIKVEPAPEYIQNRLKSVGLRPINNVVDITNYVLMELGQPLHAFDMANVKGNKVVVRLANEGEKFVTLDGVERKLSARNLMICNESEPMCIAGVFGGEKSGVSETTTDIFLESAYFNPVSIRKTAREYGLNTDASFRYERGADVNVTVYALKRAAKLICEIAGGKIASEIIDIYPNKMEDTIVDLDLNDVNTLIGKNIEKDIVKAILENLEMQVEEISTNMLRVEVPSNKVDVTRPADLVEEVLRIYGYNNIELQGRLSYSMNAASSNSDHKIYASVANMLSSTGFCEILNNSLCKQEYIENCKLGSTYKEDNIVLLANPLSKELNMLRPTLLFGGLNSIEFNLNRKQNNIKFYEFGRSYFKTNSEEEDVIKRYSEENHLALFISGNKNVEGWQEANKAADFYDLKLNVERVFNSLRVNELKYKVEESDSELFVYGLKITLNKAILVEFGLLTKTICDSFDIKQEVYYADFSWDNILKYMPKKERIYKEVSKYPSVRRDLALLIDKSVKFEQIENLAFSCERTLLKEVNLFDVYQGKTLESGKKSYAVSFILQDLEKTLTDKQIEKIMEKIIGKLSSELGASLR